MGKNIPFFFQMSFEHLPSCDKIVDLAAKPSGFVFQFCHILAMQLGENYLGKILWFSFFSCKIELL